MLNSLFIFGAEKLFLLSPLVAAWFFYKASWETKREIVIFAFFSLPLTFILAGIARELYFNPRPFAIGGFEPLIPHAPDNGFPSDHTLLLAALASLVSFFNWRYAVVLWLVTVLVGASRMYVGVHHFIDIFGSIALALLSSLIVYAVLRWGKSADIKNNV